MKNSYKFLLAAIIIPILLISSTTENKENGRYQVSTQVVFQKSLIGGSAIYETIIDTKTGDVISRKKVKLKNFNE